MVTVQKEGIILKKTNREFESHGMMNPTTIQQEEDIYLYCRGKDKMPDQGAMWYFQKVLPSVATPCIFPIAANTRTAVASINLPDLMG
jgi:hypothetical protein